MRAPYFPLAISWFFLLESLDSTSSSPGKLLLSLVLLMEPLWSLGKKEGSERTLKGGPY